MEADKKKTEQTETACAVLCVDADDLANTMVGNIVGSDAELWTARNFNQAIAAISRRPFGLVICDITEPQLRGMDVLSILANLYPSTPVLVTSESGVTEWASDAFSELGAFAGMTKPYNLNLLRGVINEALWPTPVMGRGDVGRAVLMTAGIHETAGEEMARLSSDERTEVQTVIEVLEQLMPFFANKTTQGEGQ